MFATRAWSRGEKTPQVRDRPGLFHRDRLPGPVCLQAGCKDRGWRRQGGPLPPLHPTFPFAIPTHLPQPSLLGAPKYHVRLTSSQEWLGPQGTDPTFCFPPRSPHPLDCCQRLRPLSGARGPGSAQGRGLAFAALHASSCWPSPSAPAPAGLSWMGKKGRVRRCLRSMEKAKA